jgi:hypothetical protein
MIDCKGNAPGFAWGECKNPMKNLLGIAGKPGVFRM